MHIDNPASLQGQSLCIMSDSAHTLSLFDRTEEAQCYHSPRFGYFSLLHGTPGGKRQRSYRLDDMARVLPLVDKNQDCWMSQGEFILPNRRIVNLARLGLLFADLDFYRMDHHRGRTAEEVKESLIWYCQNEADIPVPSLIISSGKGLQAKWLLDGTIPRAALPRWNLCQQRIVSELDYFGSDTAAKDASRVLRLINTVNSKNGKVCRVIHIETEADSQQPRRYNFEWLCEQLLPVARWDIEKQRSQKPKPRQLDLVHTDNQKKGLRGFSGNRLAWDRLEDLRKLMQIRGGVPEGERMTTLHWHINFLLLSGATHSRQMWHESAELARQIDPSWGYRSQELRTLYKKGKAWNAGERIEFNGKEYPPLYTPRNNHLINLFKITDDEQAQLKTIISKSEKARRDKERYKKLDKARKGWKQTRAEYENNSLSKTKPWEALGMSRAKWYRLGKPMPETQKNSETSCPRITNGVACNPK